MAALLQCICPVMTAVFSFLMLGETLRVPGIIGAVIILAGVVHTQQGSFFTSVALESANSSVLLCIEAGAMCEAHKFNEKVTHCLCVVRDDEKSPFKVLSPCGVCQERLRYWGEDVQVGVATRDGSLLFVSLKEMQPYHWTHAYPAEALEHYEER